MMFLNTGFIQANTRAPGGTGGIVSITVPILFASNNFLILGGSVPYPIFPQFFGYNVIQAAAPTGINGQVELSTPAMDLSGKLGALRTPRLGNVVLGQGRCQTTAGSSLAAAGQALPAASTDVLRAGWGDSQPSPLGVEVAPFAVSLAGCPE